MVKKPRHVTVFKILKSNLCNHHFTYIAASVCPSARQTLSNQRPKKFSTKNLEDFNNNFLFWMSVWLFGELAETNLNQFEQKITLHGNWNCSAPKKVTEVMKVAYER